MEKYPCRLIPAAGQGLPYLRGQVTANPDFTAIGVQSVRSIVKLTMESGSSMYFRMRPFNLINRELT